MTTPKQALEAARKCIWSGGDSLATVAIIDEALASLQGEDAVERVARTICQSGKFETGQGTCALICMDQLGDVRKKGCGHCTRVHGAMALAILATGLVPDEAATALTEARAEIEARDAFIKELSDALRSIRPLGGSELFVKRFGNYYADPVYCKAAIEQDAEHKHNAMKAYVKERKRADAAESELSTLRARVREVVGPIAKYVEVTDSDWAHDSSEIGCTIVNGLRHSIKLGHLRAARQLMEEVK